MRLTAQYFERYKQAAETALKIELGEEVGASLFTASQVYRVKDSNSVCYISFSPQRTSPATWDRRAAPPVSTLWPCLERWTRIRLSDGWIQVEVQTACQTSLMATGILRSDIAYGPDAANIDLFLIKLERSLALLGSTPSSPAMSVDYFTRRVSDAGVSDVPGFVTDQREWVTGHGDLNWSNVSMDAELIDWATWGRLPRWLDLATLWCYSLPNPQLAASIERRAEQLVGGFGDRGIVMFEYARLFIIGDVFHASRNWPVYSTFVDQCGPELHESQSRIVSTIHRMRATGYTSH